MRKIFLGLIILPLQTFAFLSNTEIEREMLKFDIEVFDKETSFSISEEIKNPTNIPQKTRIFWPSEKFNDVHFFVDAAGENFEILTENKKNLVAFETAKESENPAFFHFGNIQEMFRSTKLTIAPNSTIDVKIKFKTPTQESNNLKYVEIFSTDNLESKNFELSFRLNSTAKIEHFFSTLPENVLIERNDNSVTLLGIFQNLAPLENFKIFWSEINKPLLEFQTKNARYFGHLVDTPPQKDFEEAIILIDRSGSMNEVWSQVRNIVEFLTNFLENKKLKIVFFNDTTKFFNGENILVLKDEPEEKIKTNFMENSFEFRKNLFEKWNSISAVGKTNPENLSQNIKELFEIESSTRKAVFLLSDMTEFNEITEIPIPFFIFNFSEAEESPLSVFSEKSGGFSQKIFRTSSDFIEREAFLEKWQNNKEPSIINFGTFQNEIDISPTELKKFSIKNSPLFIGRKFEDWGLIKNSFENFLPRIWAKTRISDLLQTQNISNTHLDAILSIGRTFGVKNSLFNENTKREELKKALSENTFANIIEINKLKNPKKLIPDSNAKFINSVPFYYNNLEKSWQAENFRNFANRDNSLEIAPFSDAQKNIFLQFPNLLSENFAIGRNVNFCAAFRCFSIQEGFRKNSQIADRNFLRDFDPNYWANPFLEKLIFARVMGVEGNGKIKPNAPIDRGEFLNILGNYFFVKEIAEFKKPKESKFTDITKDSEFFNSIEFFANRNVIKGFSDNTFRAKQNLTRAEAVKILTTAFGFFPNEGAKSAMAVFSDAVSWEKPFVNFAAQNNIISISSNKLFHPEKNLSRAEAAKMIVLSKNFIK
jgi:hypothetical protein